MEEHTAHPRRGLRVAAGVVDVVVSLGLAALLAFVVQPLSGLADDTPSVPSALLLAAAVLAVVLVPFGLLVGLEARFGTSPGKALLGLRVRTDDGAAPGLRRSLRRTAYRASPVGLVGATWSLATGDQRTWHDQWSGTVVHGRPDRAPVALARSAAAPPAERAAPVVGAIDVLEAFTTAVTPVGGGGRGPGVAGPASPSDAARPAGPAGPGPTTAPAAPIGVSSPEEVDVAGVAATGHLPPPGDASRSDGGDGAAQPPGHDAPSPAGGPAAPASRSDSSGAEAPARSSTPAECRCAQVERLEGDDAVTYAGGHLRAVRRRPEAGELVLVCPITKAVWLAREPWATDGGATTLVRQASRRRRQGAPASSPCG